MLPTQPQSPRPSQQISPVAVFNTNGMLEPSSLSRPGVFLRPGDWFFGRGDHRVTTLLGSCVSTVMWSPRLQLGAISHCLLPARPNNPAGTGHSEGHYIDETFDWMVRCMSEHGCRMTELDVALAGGASTNDITIGSANVAMAVRLVQDAGMRLVQQDTGGRVVRRLTFNLTDGCLSISHGGRLGHNGT